MSRTLDDQLDEALAKNEELQAKLDQVTKHSRQWEERAKANKVDLAGGKPHESDSSDEAKFKKAKGNPLELAKLLIR